MRIIELGDIDVRFICPECHTVFEISTKELERTGDRSWETACPLCGKPMAIGDGGTIDFLIKREELGNGRERESPICASHIGDEPMERLKNETGRENEE